MLDKILYLPDGYVSRPEPSYFDDILGIENAILYQPEVYPVAEYLLNNTGRSRIVDVGCGIGEKLAGATAREKLGIDFGANIARCRMAYPEGVQWCERDLGNPVGNDMLDRIGPDDVVICSDVIEHIPDPRPLADFLARCFQRGALVMTSTPERRLVRGPEHLGPPPNLAHVREWSLPEYGAFLEMAGLPPLFIGLTHNNDQDRLLRTILSLHEPRLQSHYEAKSQRPLAILSCFNEEDVIAEVVEHWISQGCDLHILDNWSTDRSGEILRGLKGRFGRHLIVEQFPAGEPSKSSWRDILARKEEIALCHKGRWIIHTDADEIRRSPLSPFNLADAMALVERAGWNRISFTVLNHRPTNGDAYIPGNLMRSLPAFEYGTKPGHFVQKKAWLQGDSRVHLTDSGGHVADFPEASDCPYHFILHHFPLRSVEHGRRKINLERYGRWSTEELDMGWHHHYDDLSGDANLVWDRASLHDMDANWWIDHGLQILCDVRR